MIAFSTANRLPAIDEQTVRGIEMLPNVQLSALFPAVAEATEEAIVNALLGAESMTGRDGNEARAIPLDRLVSILRRHGR